jgi:hypothetical protein
MHICIELFGPRPDHPHWKQWWQCGASAQDTATPPFQWEIEHGKLNWACSAGVAGRVALLRTARSIRPASQLAWIRQGKARLASVRVGVGLVCGANQKPHTKRTARAGGAGRIKTHRGIGNTKPSSSDVIPMGSKRFALQGIEYAFL